MQNLPISKLRSGMVLAESVYVPGSSQLLLSDGAILTDKAIARLEFYSIYSVKVKNTEAGAKRASGIPENATFSERIRHSMEFVAFSNNYNHDIVHFKSALNDAIVSGSPLNPDELLTDTLKLLHAENSKVNLFDMLTNLRSYDDATYAHNINVALISNVFAGWLHYSPEDIQTATLCGLLHDIGKMMIPESIIKKSGALTPEEFEIMKSHTVQGYQKLREMNIDARICNAALMHHERCDGSGYPLGLKDEQISSFASLVGLADVYDAMTSARAYRNPLCPFHVISLLESDGYQKYAPQYLMTFLENIANSYLLYTVLLSDGREGTIVYINKDKYSCPTVKVGEEYIDLFKRNDLTIEKVI